MIVIGRILPVYHYPVKNSTGLKSGYAGDFMEAAAGFKAMIQVNG